MLERGKNTDNVSHDFDRSLVLSTAFECVDRGFTVVPAIEKMPAVRWKRYQDPSVKNTRSELREWWGDEANQDFNLAIVTGRASGLVVVDCDSKDEATLWEKDHPKTPLVVHSGGSNKGRHFFYQAPNDEVVESRIRVDRRKLDIKAERGLVIAPPSQHPETGVLYRWETSLEQVSLDDIPVFDPTWIDEAEPESASLSHLKVPKRRDIRNPEAYAQSIMRIQSVSGQGGDRACFVAACILRDCGLSPAEALAEMVKWSQVCAEPPWSRRALAHKVREAFKRKP